MDKPQRKLGIRVPPRRTANIFSEAQGLRDELKLKGKVDIGRLLMAFQDAGMLEFSIVKADESIFDDEETFLGDEEARAYPDSDFIAIREDVYDKACGGCGHSRFTIAHELGHIVMHKGVVASFARGGEHQIFEDSEWQADVFASEFLADSRLIDLDIDTPATVSERFGVTEEAAIVKLSKLRSIKEKREAEEQ
ncbi:ImmA/IrrE family metallo-endopeptidase [Vibrio sp. Vb2880]|uniref:ImmA/IrrE family metallo-endopeptidase n=1 Tax=Vibrio sp. Vb2880 TaxID=2816076 RepID=UPI001A8C064A|nr:ImmA/IrrE family metallo-endopeptidase [Vibrio sp. Vb2880]MBO0213020.1 ImmA/IrrE family metallo-endopeptidase [Vibrio sp. Vb2880]